MVTETLLKKIRILFIEDDDVQRSEFSIFLKRRFDKVYLSKNGEEGFRKYIEQKPDMILTDLRMPKVNGLELVKKIRTLDRLIPIIIITAINDKETILKSVDIGITNYIVKPINVKELMNALEEASKTLLEIDSDKFSSMIDKNKINNLKNELTKYIKKETGKGPTDIRISLKKKNLHITIYNNLTVYEKNMIKYDKNIALVDHNRNVFFRDRFNFLEEIIESQIDISLKFIDVKSNSYIGECILIFEL